MKQITVLSKAKPIQLITSDVNNILLNKLHYIILPLFNKDLIETNQMLYVKEPFIRCDTNDVEIFYSYNEKLKSCYKNIINDTTIFYTSIQPSKLTPFDLYAVCNSKQMQKNESRLFLTVKSVKCCSIQSLTNSDILNTSNNKDSFINHWNELLESYLINTSNHLMRNRLLNDYSYKNNPTIQFCEIEITNLSNN